MKPKLTLLCASLLLFGALTGCNKKSSSHDNKTCETTESSETTTVESPTDTDTGSTEGGNTEGTGTEDTGSEDTGSEDTGTEDTGTEGSGTEGGSTEDTNTEDTGNEGTGTEDTGSGDTEEPPVADKYQVTFGSGSSMKGYNFTETTLDEDDVKSEVVKKYVAQNINAKAGDPINFYLNEQDIYPGDEKKNGVDNGNNTQGEWKNYQVRQDVTNGFIYLKAYADGYSFWLTGYEKPANPGPHGPEGSEHVEWYIVGDGSLWTTTPWNISDSVQMFNNPSNQEDKGCILNITFSEGDVFKIINKVGDNLSWFGYDKVNKGEHESNAGIVAFEGVDDNNGGQNIRCKTAGTYAIYVQSSGLFWITNYTE